MTGHHPDLEVAVDRRAERLLRAGIAAMAVVTLVGLALLRPGDGDPAPDGAPFAVDHADATIVGFSLAPCAGTRPEDDIDCFEYDIEVTSGPTAGERASFQQAVSEGGVDLDPGDRIVVGYTADAPETARYVFVDFQRHVPLLVLTVLFVAAVVALGRWQGVRALVGAGAAVALLAWYLLPALLEGATPLPVALVSASAIAFVAIYVTHGTGVRSSVALAGTLASLVLVGALGVVFIEASQLTGLASEEATLLQLGSVTLDIQGLVLAGLVIGSLGVLDDVTVTQVSAVWELRAARPDEGRRRTFVAALRIGRDHIASTVNTLVLAYAGASLPLLLLFSQSDQSLSRVLTGEVVAVEVVRTLVGSIGLVAAVPLSTALAVALLAPVRPLPDLPGQPDDGRPAPDRPPAATGRDGDGDAGGGGDAGGDGDAGGGGAADWEEFAPREDTF